MTLGPWATVADLPADRPPLDDDAWRRHLDLATGTLWALSGRQWPGQRTVAVEVYAPRGHACADPCAPRPVRLPHRDARDLAEVRTADGTPLDAGAYRITRGGYLDAAPGRAARLPTAATPLVVRYTAGRNPPAAGVAAAVTLAVELGRDQAQPGTSALPTRVTSITRQAVTVTYESLAEVLGRGGTGLPPVDSWLATVNPSKLRRPPRSWSPDTDSYTTTLGAAP